MKDLNLVARYIGGAFTLYLCWFLLYDHYLEPMGQPDQWLTTMTAVTAAWGLDWLGYPVEVSNTSPISYLLLNSKKVLGVGHACNALVLFAIFVGFIIIFPGKTFHKLWFMATGIMMVFFVNVLRVLSLTLVSLHWPQAVDFNHKYTFTFLVYGVIFGLWMLWIKKFSTVKNHYGVPEDYTKQKQLV